MQLINITTQPAKLQCKTVPGRLEMRVPKFFPGKVNRVPTKMDIHTKDIAVRLDTKEMRASLNLRSTMDWSKIYAEQGMQAAYEAIGAAVQLGNQIQNVQDGVTIPQIFQQKMLQSTDITTYTRFLPSTGPDISWEPAQVSLDYSPGSVDTEWEIQRNVMNYIPGEIHFELIQKPKITFEYLGKPTYVPPSSEPGYVKK